MIGVKSYDKVYKKIIFKKKNGDLYISKAEYSWAKDILESAGTEISKLYDDFLEYKNYKEDNIYGVKPINSNFLVDISCYDVSICATNKSFNSSNNFELSFPDYYDENLDYGTSLGGYEDEMRAKYPYVEYDSKVSIMSESDYNKLAKIYNLDTVKLEKGEYAIVSNYETNIYQEVLNRNSIINIFGNDLKPYKNLVDGFQMIGGNPTNLGFFVVQDDVIDKESKHEIMLVGNYSTKDEKIINISTFLFYL